MESKNNITAWSPQNVKPEVRPVSFDGFLINVISLTYYQKSVLNYFKIKYIFSLTIDTNTVLVFEIRSDT